MNVSGDEGAISTALYAHGFVLQYIGSTMIHSFMGKKTLSKHHLLLFTVSIII